MTEQPTPNFDIQKELTDSEREDFKFVKDRIYDLQRSQDPAIEKVWRDADKDYIPHRFQTKGRRVIATDEDKGWRGTMVTLGASEWQSDISQPNPYTKIQTALSLLVDQNPSGVFSATSKKYQATSKLMEQLYQRSWEYAKSKQQLKLFVFNLAKYGWSAARTFPLRIARKTRVLVEYDPENPDRNKYEEKEVVEFNDIFRENLDVWNTWVDDTAKPGNQFSIRDWSWRKVYAWDAAEEEFGSYPNWKYVKPGGNTDLKLKGVKANKEYKESKLVEVLFYENRLKDLFMVIANDIPVVISPLPISDNAGNKKLSLWQAMWSLRDTDTIYGIGMYESMRNDQDLLDRIRNMTIDQLTLSIYKMFFYQGTQMLSETGDIKVTPGVGKQALDPSKINWLQVPGPGAEAWNGLDRFKQDVDKSSGISDTLEGTITGKTAFEIAQAKEAALKRLKIPLDNILDALNQDGYITVSLIQTLYSIPETYEIADVNLIDEYMSEVDGDAELFDIKNGKFTAKVYPEFPLNLSKDEKGNLVETKDTQFFRIKPSGLKWEGIINIKSQSILTPSKQVDKALEQEMYNMLIPLLAQDPSIYSKIAKSIVKLYEKDPKDILPEAWLQDGAQQQSPMDQSLIVPKNQAQQGTPGTTNQMQPTPNMTPQQAPTMNASTQAPQQPQGIAQQIMSRLSQPFRKV